MIRRILGLLLCVLLAVMPALGMAQTTFTMAGFDGEDSTRDWPPTAFLPAWKRAPV